MFSGESRKSRWLKVNPDFYKLPKEGGVSMHGESQNKKEKWFKPKLIILTRGKPEEAILLSCKSSASGGPHHMDNKCATLTCVTPCDDIIGSQS